ncbi:acyltransferase family protein [Pseudomonas botevensis]|uniref:acyltransferase family protein n=1 Tax=Pseudomonas botevensis TaxID=2842352 RepID=UPI001C3C930A|nr:acyltransferase family protein [Pseudomonas botevensis]MBV4475973.1 acyltransferase [Pseudomonas botevensis]
MSNPNIQYRPDIDGLRALAVLGVVIYHAFPSLLPGGFVGVDVFFVISGYLIGTILLKSLAKDTFSFSDFYSRRIRRIFPALFVVLAFCLITGKLVLLDDEYRQLGKHVAAGATFIANFAFWSESGYFDTAAELKPLLHLWSLAIEEQFYLFWPLVLWGAWKLRANMLAVTIVIAIVSFAINITQINSNPVATFFLLPSRAWELLAGSILAWLALQGGGATERTQLRTLLDDLAGMLGLALIVWAMFFVHKSDAFPGWFALAPVTGAVLLIAAGPQARVNRFLLSNKPAVFIGLISFPLYLWHWPLLSFARIVQSDVLSREIRLAAVLLAIGLAWLTFKFIEPPFRSGNHRLGKVVALVSVMVVAGAIGYKGLISPKGVDEAETMALTKSYQTMALSKENCEKQFPDWTSITDNACRFQKESDNSVAIVGDSHAGQLFLGISEQLKPSEGVAVFSASCAAPYIDIATAQKDENAQKVRKGAYKLINRAYDYIIDDPKIKVVILAHLPNCSYQDATDMRNPANGDYKTALSDGMKRTFSALTQANKKVIVLLDNPYLPYDPAACAERPFRLTKNADHCSFPREQFDKNQPFTDYKSLVVAATKDFPQVKILDLSTKLCDENRCYLAKDGRLLYSDNSHLNFDGSRYVAPYLIDAIESNN